MYYFRQMDAIDINNLNSIDNSKCKIIRKWVCKQRKYGMGCGVEVGCGFMLRWDGCVNIPSFQEW